MKKLLSVLLLLCMILSLAACAGGASSDKPGEATQPTEKSAGFQAGFGKVDITPDGSVSMAGYGDQKTRFSSGFATYLEARAVAIIDENGDKLVFIVADTSFAYPAVAGNAITTISAKLGVPESHIIISGTHTHNSVATFETSTPDTVKFNTQYVDGCYEAAKMALEDCKPADIYVGSLETQNLNFVRRYFMDDGSICGDGTYGTGTTIVAHETEVDNEAQLLKFAREDGQDILVINFQAHPHLEGKLNSLSADTPAGVRDAVEKKFGVHCLYWQGAAGNINSASRIEGETLTKKRTEYGEIFAKQLSEVYDSMTQVQSGPIKVTSTVYSGDANHTEDHLLIEASDVMSRFQAGESIEKCTVYAKELGLNSFYHARNIVNHAKMGATYDMEISAFSFGDVAGVVVPYEMFDQSGMQIKEQSPFEKSFIIGYAYPGYQGYVPTALAWEHGGYEVETSNYGPGNAEKLVDAYLGLLNDLKKNSIEIKTPTVKGSAP